ncbi:MAG: DNA repair protein RadA [Myxococcales bacterium]|jgi:DNA repair protein RadA/Sms
MAKTKTFYSCQSCGHKEPKWLGRCPDCGGWNTLVEEVEEREEKRGWGATSSSGKPVRLLDVTAVREDRMLTAIGELDRVLGGGVVAGGLVLLGGDPGIGKSTLLLAALARLSHHGPTLYVTGEESLRQTRMRAERMGIDAENLHLMAETDADKVIAAAEKLRPCALAVDSIQTLFLPELGSAPGTISQVREVAGRLMAYAKRTETPTFIVGHVTKDGAIAGPRVLEHMVDTVLYFEGDRGHPYRVLRAHKNRFGSTNEIGVFEMKSSGLSEVLDPSALFLAERPVDASGSVVTASVSGTRPLLVELQALVAPTGYGTARRTTMGVDHNRVALLAAVLEKKEGVDLVGCDLFVNVAGGIELSEPSADLAILAALVSSVRDRPIDAKTMVFGEVGLAGEVRAVAQVEPRLAEAAKMGFKRAVLPAASVRNLERPPLALVPVSTVGEALEKLFER